MIEKTPLGFRIWLEKPFEYTTKKKGIKYILNADFAYGGFVVPLTKKELLKLKEDINDVLSGN